MLKRLRVKNFKLLRDVDIEFNDPLTVFIGPNSSGKSTVLEVIEFLRRCAEDGLSEAVTAHGGFAAIRTLSESGPVEIESHWKFSTTKGDPAVHRVFDVKWTLVLRSTNTGVITVREQVLDGEKVCVSTNDSGARFAHREGAREPPRPLGNVTRLSFEELRDSVRFPVLSHLQSVSSRSRYLGVLATASPWAQSSPDRASARDSVVLAPSHFVGPEGIGLANALYNLHTDHPDAWNILDATFRAEYPFVKRIVFPPDAGGSKIAMALEDRRFRGKKIYASQMSDGMIAYLTLLVSAVHPEQRAVLALDEPDVHLHPSALRRFIALCRSKGVPRRIALVTHSNALLDALGDDTDAIRIVEPTPEGARIRKLDPAALAAWRKDYTLSEMRATGLLDPDNGAYEDPA